MNLHNQHTTTYLGMSKGLAESGIEKWTVEAGNVMRIEAIDKR